MKRNMLTGLLMLACSVSMAQYKLIAHRGGVVDSTADENSREALEGAVKRGYWMIEADVRLTKDGVLITHHDATFKRSFGLDSAVSAMNWSDIQQLKNDKGYRILQFEEVLRLCKGRLNIMIDNKIRGNDTTVWNRMISLLKKYDLYDHALTIGTDESTEFFTGKIKLSCTRKQLEANMQKSSYKSSDYYLFSGKISREDAEWAKQHNILTIGVVNAWPHRSEEIWEKSKAQAEALKAAGVTNFQIDSVFEPLFQ